MTFLGSVYFGSFLHKKILKIVFYDSIGIKKNILQAGLIIIYSLLLYSFFLLFLKDIKIKTFLWSLEVSQTLGTVPNG